MRLSSLLLALLLTACATAREADMAPSAPLAGGERAPLTANRSIVRSASLRLERAEPETGPAQAVELAKGHGGYAELVTRESATVRVPAERLEAFLAAVPALGQVADQNISAVDVTDTHRDLKVRLGHLETMRARYQELLQRAGNVSEAVLVEKELERVTAEYETLKAQLQSLEGQVALATVRLDFARPVRPGPLGWVFYGLAKGLKWLFIWE